MGIRPSTEVIHPIAATGSRPLRIEVYGLPQGIELDDGILRGTAPAQEGTHPLRVRVSNDEGSVEGPVELCVGPTLALTPPLGWNSWNVFKDRVSARVIVEVGEAMVETGMRDLGYQYVNIDDHWHGIKRAPDGSPVPDPDKFPDGIAPVAEALHSMGLKLGIYSDAAELTCGGCFGGLGHEEIDARTYARWGVDLLKYDYCHAPVGTSAAIARYRTMGEALESSGRSIVFNVCEWGLRRPWRWGRRVGASYWRTTNDIWDTFTFPFIGVRSIARRNMRLADHAGPGHWNDPDMLVVGNRGAGRMTSCWQPFPSQSWQRLKWRFPGLDDEQARSHITLWAMMAAPLLASHDFRAVGEYDLALLRNPDMLAIDQDPLGKQARRRRSAPGTWLLVKQLEGGSRAASITNVSSRPRRVTVDLGSLGVPTGATVRDIWTGAEHGGRNRIEVALARHGSAAFLCEPPASS